MSEGAEVRHGFQRFRSAFDRRALKIIHGGLCCALTHDKWRESTTHWANLNDSCYAGVCDVFG